MIEQFLFWFGNKLPGIRVSGMIMGRGMCWKNDYKNWKSRVL